mgnify:CR=1 FL=1
MGRENSSARQPGMDQNVNSISSAQVGLKLYIRYILHICKKNRREAPEHIFKSFGNSFTRQLTKNLANSPTFFLPQIFIY